MHDNMVVLFSWAKLTAMLVNDGTNISSIQRSICSGLMEAPTRDWSFDCKGNGRTASILVLDELDGTKTRDKEPDTREQDQAVDICVLTGCLISRSQ